MSAFNYNVNFQFNSWHFIPRFDLWFDPIKKVEISSEGLKLIRNSEAFQWQWHEFQKICLKSVNTDVHGFWAKTQYLILNKDDKSFYFALKANYPLQNIEYLEEYEVFVKQLAEHCKNLTYEINDYFDIQVKLMIIYFVIGVIILSICTYTLWR